jgi:hypothetical protein
MPKRFACLPLLACLYLHTYAQQVTLTPDQIKGYTPEWKGERYPDGRPKTPDKLLERLKKVRLEEAWGILRNKGYQINSKAIGWCCFPIQ